MLFKKLFTLSFIGLYSISFIANASMKNKNYSTLELGEVELTEETRKHKKFNPIKEMKKKWRSRKKRRLFFKVEKNQRLFYQKINENHFGEKFTLSNNIAQVATKMMEKHYGGVQSFIAGATCLREMVDHKNNLKKLRETYVSCDTQLKFYQREIKKRKIKFVDHFKDSERTVIREKLLDLFNNNIQLTVHLLKAQRPTLKCSTKGGTFSLAFFAGGAASHYQLKCKSQLGRRVIYGLSSLKIGAGIGGTLSFKKTKYRKLADNKFEKVTRTFPYSFFRSQKGHIATTASASVLVGTSLNSTNEVTKVDNMGLGLGFFAGTGGGGLYKIKDRTPDFKELFSLLEMGFHS